MDKTNDIVAVLPACFARADFDLSCVSRCAMVLAFSCALAVRLPWVASVWRTSSFRAVIFACGHQTEAKIRVLNAFTLCAIKHFAHLLLAKVLP